jgi:hypothetical protein
MCDFRVTTNIQALALCNDLSFSREADGLICDFLSVLSHVAVCVPVVRGESLSYADLLVCDSSVWRHRDSQVF